MPDVPPEMVEELLMRLDVSSMCLPAPVVFRLMLRRLQLGGLPPQDIAELMGQLIVMLQQEQFDVDVLELLPSQPLLLEVRRAKIDSRTGSISPIASVLIVVAGDRAPAGVHAGAHPAARAAAGGQQGSYARGAAAGNRSGRHRLHRRSRARPGEVGGHRQRWQSSTRGAARPA